MSLGNGVADDAASQSKATCEQVAAGPHLAADFRAFNANSRFSSCHIADIAILAAWSKIASANTSVHRRSSTRPSPC